MLIVPGLRMDPMLEIRGLAESEWFADRHEATNYLETVPTVEAAQLLVDMLAREEDRMSGLGSVLHDNAKAIVHHGRTHDVRARAVGKQARLTIINALHGTAMAGWVEPENKEWAIWCLGEIGNREAIPALKEILGEEDGECPARKALRKLGYYSTGERFEIP